MIRGLMQDALIPLRAHDRPLRGRDRARDGLAHCGDAFFHHGDIDTPRRCPPGMRIYETLAQHSGKERHRNLERLRELNREHGDEVTLICSHDARMLDDSQAAMSLDAGRGPRADKGH